MSTNKKIFLVKKGSADPFRGDWYTQEVSFTSENEAITEAARLTIADHSSYGNSWEQYGYEWSVFEKIGEEERKIWEGYKFIMSSGNESNDLELGGV